MSDLTRGNIEILLGEVPKYLQAGDYFKEFKECSDELVSIPSNVLRADLNVENLEDFKHLLISYRFWVVNVDDYLEVITKIIRNLSDSPQLRALIQEFQADFPTLRVLSCLLFDIPRDDLESKFSPLPLVQNVLMDHTCSKAIVAYLVDGGCKIVRLGDDSEMKELKQFLSTVNVHTVVQDDRLELLKHLYENEIRSTSLCYHAAECGQLACLEYLVSQNSHLHIKTSLIAATNGHLHILKFLYEKKKPLDDYCCRMAAKNGHLECLEYLHSIGRPWGVHVPSHAARYRHLDCLKFAYENGCPWDASTCCDAAEGGHLDCLRYAREQGCPWDNRTTLNAIRHFPCLVYSLENDCPYSANLAEYAFKAGCDASGFYILEHCRAVSNTIVSYAAREKRADIAEACARANITCDLSLSSPYPLPVKSWVDNCASCNDDFVELAVADADELELLAAQMEAFFV